MKQFTNFLIAIFLTLALFSCSKQNERIYLPNVNTTRNDAANIEASKFTNRNIFGVALAKALGHSKQLSALIKNMADTKFDGTYDMLYSELMNQTIEGVTVNDYIEQFADDKDLFQKAISQSPLMTIYIPNLPSGWNIDTWKPQIESPSVVIAKNLLDDKRVMNYYDSEGKLTQISDRLIPGDATLVIKENARVILKPYADLIKKTYSPKSDLPVFYKKLNGEDVYFLSDRLLKQKQYLPSSDFVTEKSIKSTYGPTNSEKTVSPSTTNPSYYTDDMYQAYAYFGTSWPRDYIYYGLTPTNTNGFFNNRSTERAILFWFESSAIFPQISTETTDPKIINIKSQNSDPSWTSGSYLMTFTLLINAKNGIGLTIKKVVAIDPRDVWNVTYSFNGIWYTYQSISPNLYPGYQLNLDLLPFDISNYSIAWKISIEDTRPSETQTITNSYTSTFSENFSLDPTFGLLKKIGLKLGASATQSSTQTHTTATTFTSVQLGDIVINFSDPILLVADYPPIYPFYSYGYSTGSVGLIIMPQRLW